MNVLSAYEELINALETAFKGANIFTHKSEFPSLKEAIQALDIGETIILTEEKDFAENISQLHIIKDSDNGYHKEALRKTIDDGHIFIYKVLSKDGFDLQMFSKKNVYRDMFFQLQKLVPDHFRFFSINGKKFDTERHFYFETWTLDRPPHGFEEVQPESVL